MGTISRRLLSVVAGLVMIVLSLIVQLLIFTILGLITVPMVLPGLDPRASVLALLFLYNGASCYEYFRRRKVVGLRGRLHALEGLVMPGAGHVSMAIFLVPRGVERIATGRERVR